MEIRTDGNALFDLFIEESTEMCKATLIQQGIDRSWEISMVREAKLETTLDELMGNAMDIVKGEGFKMTFLALKLGQR
jgi:hypothetical protein